MINFLYRIAATWAAKRFERVLSSLTESDRALLEDKLVYFQSDEEIAEELTRYEQAFYLPNTHPLWGCDNPPVVTASEVNKQIERLLAYLKANGYDEEDIRHMLVMMDWMTRS